MAVIKFGSIVTSGRGSLGGSTIQPCHSGHIWRNKPTPTKSRTQAQSIIRGYNKTMQAGWRSLSDQDRKVWNDYAQLHQVCNRSGEKHPLSGHSLWLKYQFTYLSNDLPFLITPSNFHTNPIGPEIVLNGTFDDSSHWIVKSSWVISGGKANYIDIATNTITQYTPFKKDFWFLVSFDISDCPTTGRLLFVTTPGDAILFSSPFNIYIHVVNGHYSAVVKTLNAGTLGYRLYGSVAGDIYSLDNLSIKQVYL